MKIEIIPISKLKNHPDNPRTIKDEKYNKLKESIKGFSSMLELRELILNEDYQVLGGNMRLKAAKELKFKEMPCKVFTREMAERENLQKKEEGEPTKTYEEYCKEFVIKDNLSYGEWEWAKVKDMWGEDVVTDWGMEIDDFFEEEEEKENNYSRKIKAPNYEPSEIKPEINELFDTTKYDSLVKDIEASKLPEHEKEFLKLAASRHIVFDYGKIADYYSNSVKEAQNHMENSALVIIDFDKAIENGYVELSEKLHKLFAEDYDEK